jgi:hypothetical protein
MRPLHLFSKKNSLMYTRTVYEGSIFSFDRIMSTDSKSAATVVQDIRKDLELLCTILNKWIPNRKKVRKELNLLADDLNKLKSIREMSISLK